LPTMDSCFSSFSLSPIHSPNERLATYNFRMAFAEASREGKRIGGLQQIPTQIEGRRGCGMFSVRRLTLWPRHVRPELVGFSASSHLAQRDAAKAWYLANSLRNPLGFHSKSAAQSPWRRAD
jgi:hypothetical protein